MKNQGYDLIGDIHGESMSLVALLLKLGYKRKSGVYQHSSRQAIFLGDFIDRGIHQKEVLDIVRLMIEQDHALAVMGNHEFNAISYHAGYREHSPKNQKQHQAFLDAFQDDPDKKADMIGWFKTLPLWLDLGPVRVVHACWHTISMTKVEAALSEGFTDEFLKAANENNSELYDAVETLLKGKEIRLPAEQHFTDKDGNHRHHIRIKWWDNKATNYKTAYLGPESALSQIPDDEIDGDHLIEYGRSEPPVFVGHYWMEGKPEVFAENVACLDYSVAKPGGKLVAYQWDGESKLLQEKFTWVERGE